MESNVCDIPSTITVEDICTIIGNLIDNSVDAVQFITDAEIHLFFIESTLDALEIEISNNGPYLEASPEEVFSKGYTTKGDGRGYGLYLVHQIITYSKGDIYWQNGEGEVTWFVKL